MKRLANLLVLLILLGFIPTHAVPRKDKPISLKSKNKKNKMSPLAKVGYGVLFVVVGVICFLKYKEIKYVKWMEKTYLSEDLPLHEAAREGNVDKLKELLEQSPSIINKISSNNETALSAACLNSKWNAVEFLLDQKGINVNLPIGKGSSLIASIALWNQFDTLERLITKEGLDPPVDVNGTVLVKDKKHSVLDCMYDYIYDSIGTQDKCPKIIKLWNMLVDKGAVLQVCEEAYNKQYKEGDSVFSKQNLKQPKNLASKTED